ncbi:hypothetical protein LAZ67_23001487 [Cordylochernes scorpioides]|uniref:Uncharacterized protein n=1 Tax=Cordylochernes scorpioides TaxID=51811 RepID=A0ABY6LVJ1_9ARAC|nr:hypothetical protein LAZ67_23001487 [Cordylochernes scorpioides]
MGHHVPIVSEHQLINGTGITPEERRLRSYFYLRKENWNGFEDNARWSVEDGDQPLSNEDDLEMIEQGYSLLKTFGSKRTCMQPKLFKYLIKHSPKRTIVFEWHSRFKAGRISIEDDLRQGRPKISKD